MSTKKVGFVHTTPATIGMVDASMKAYLPGVEFIHIYDGNVKLANFSSPIGVTPKINLLRYAEFAYDLEQAGCRVIVSCCSLMPRAVAFASEVVNVLFIQLDAVILDEAAANYSRIGVIHTTPYSVPYIREGLLLRAERQGRKLELIFSDKETERALDFFNAGDFDTHDDVVLQQMRRMEQAGMECLLMGQIPLAMMEEKIKAQSWSVPVLCPGESAFRHVATLLHRS